MRSDKQTITANAARRQAFRIVVEGIAQRNANTDPDELQALIDATVHEVRNERRPR